jgi:hypothetical protein
VSKISELSDGGSLVSSDYLIAVRSGGNVKVRMDQINVDQVDLGDNEFIRLGNSQDLTMVHTSTQSIINQAGTGDLLIQKAGSTKLTINASGIDVTGTVTADGLTVQTTGSTTAVLTLNNADGNGTLSQINLGYTADPDHGNIQYTGDMIFTAAAAERMRINSVGTTSIKTDGTTQLILNRADASIQATNQVAQILVTGDDPSASQSGAAISFTAADAWATNSYPTNIIFSNDQSGTLTPRMTLDASGNLLVGTTDEETYNFTSGGGTALWGNGLVSAAKSGAIVGIFNRTGSEGDILQFRNGGAPVGSIGTGYGVVNIKGGSAGLLMGNTAVLPVDGSGTLTSDSYDIGAGGFRFKDLFLSGGVVFGDAGGSGTSSSNTLDSYEEGTWTGTLTGTTTAPSTAQTATGYYTKIGGVVTLWIEFNNKDVTGASGPVKITGQPFTPASGKTSTGAGYSSRGATTLINSYFTSTSGGILFIDYAGSGVSWASTGSGTYVQATITFTTT